MNIRTITVGNRHADPGDPAKVVAYHRWLLAYVLAEREEIPIVIGTKSA